MHWQCYRIHQTLGRRDLLLFVIFSMTFLFFTQASTLGYSENIDLPSSSLSFSSSFSPAGTSFEQILGFQNHDPIISYYSIAIDNGIEVHSSAYTPTSLSGHPNVNSSGFYTASITRPVPFSYLTWSLQGSTQSILAAHAPEESMGRIGYAFTVSGRADAGGTSSTFQGPSIWASADYWFPNSEFLTDCSLVKVRLTFSSMRVQVYSTELTISASSGSGIAPLQVSFTASAKDGIAPYSYNWVFGGLGSSNLQNPSFTFQSPGVYTVQCTATDSVGITDTKSITIVVSSLWLDISSQGSGTTSPSEGSYSKAQGEQVTINANPSTGSALERWLLDGSDIGSANPVKVIMNSNHSLKAIFIEALSVSARASPPSGDAPLIVAFSSWASGGKPPYSFSWTFGDGGTSTNQNTSHAYSGPGSYTAILRATDSAGKIGECRLDIEVTDAAPGMLVWVTKSNDIAVAQGSSSSSTIGVFSSMPAVADLTLEWLGSVPASSSTFLSKVSAATNYTAMLSFSAGSNTPVGTYTLRVTASAGGLTGHADVMVTVSQSYCALTLFSGQGGTTSPKPGILYYPAGSQQQFTALPSVGYAFLQWRLDGAYYSSSAQVTLLIDRSHSLSASFYKLPPQVNGALTFETLRWNGTGWATGNFPDRGVVSIIAGLMNTSFSDSPHLFLLPLPVPFSFQFIPICDDGLLSNATSGPPTSKLFSLQTINSSGITSIMPAYASYPNFCPVRVDRGLMTIRLMIKASDFAVKIASPTPTWGSVEVSSDSPGWSLYSQNYSVYTNGFGDYLVDTGCNISVSAIAFNGYYFDRIVVGNRTYYSPEVEVGPVISNNSITVYYSAVPTTFNLEISSTSGGSTLPSPGDYDVLRYSTQDISISGVEDGFFFAGWFLDGAYAGGSPSISLLMDQDHSILAKFENSSYDPDRLNAKPCDLETGMMYRRLIVGECVGINVSGRVSGISSPTLVSVTAWFSNGSALHWDGTPGSDASDGYAVAGKAMTNGSGFFSIVLGNLSSCWIVGDLATGSNHSVFAEVRVTGLTTLAIGSWTAERILPHTSFSYNASGALAAIRLTYSDGSPLEGRAGSYLASFEEANFGTSAPNDASGDCTLWIPYRLMEGLPYISSNWSIALFSNLSGSPSTVPSVIPCQVRFSDISCQFLMHNDTHLALQVFDWGSAGLDVVEGASAIIWWGNSVEWGSRDIALNAQSFGSSTCSFVRNIDGSFSIVSSDQQSWQIDPSLSVDYDGAFMNGVILIVHQSLSQSLSECPAGSRLFLLLVPPNSSSVLYCPTRSGTFLLASSLAPPSGW